MKYIYAVIRYLGYISTAFVGLMTLLTVADVGGRYIFDNPIGGVTELSPLMLVVIVAMGLGWCALERKHVKVDILASRLPQKFQYITDNIFLVIGFILFGIITWRTVLEALEINQTTSLLGISFTPFYWLFSIGLLIFCISILVILIENLREGARK
jgi:TRAP-type C4-dicarboxylate transport system permease small subunit